MPKLLEIDQDNLCMKSLALNVDFSNQSLRVSERGTFLKSGYLFAVGLSNVKMVADRHRHVACHNKHW